MAEQEGISTERQTNFSFVCGIQETYMKKQGMEVEWKCMEWSLKQKWKRNLLAFLPMYLGALPTSNF